MPKEPVADVFLSFHQMRQKEFEQIDTARMAVDSWLRQQANDWRDIQYVARTAVDGAPVTASDLSETSIQATGQKIGRYAGVAVQNAGIGRAKQIHAELQNMFHIEVDHLYRFSVMLDHTMSYLKHQTSTKLTDRLKKLWLNQSNSLDEAFAAGVIYHLLGFPALMEGLVDLPAPPQTEPAAFKKAYQQAVSAAIEQHAKSRNTLVDEIISQYTAVLFSPLKTSIDSSFDEYQAI